MRAIGIVGYHNSGKTTLARALAQELRDRGYTVAAVKHASERVDLEGKDTARLAEVANPVGFISEDRSGILWRGARRLEDLLPHIKADLLVIEGFKTQKTFPKVVCLTGQPQDTDLLDDLVICTVGPVPSGVVADVPLLGLDDIGEIADLAVEKALDVPGLDCGPCGDYA
jgi:molybdopterin-guanine dinucleotide biosynthesis protein B